MATQLNTLRTSSTNHQVQHQNKTIYERNLLERLLPNLQFEKFATKKSYNKNEGDTIQFRKFNSLPLVTTPLTEGVTPDGQTLEVTAKTVQVDFYGNYVMLTDVIDMIGIDKNVLEATDLLGEQASELINHIIAEVIYKGTNVQYSGGVSSEESVTAKISGEEIRKAVKTMRKNKVQPYDGKHYIMFVDAETEYDLMSMEEWVDIGKYQNATQIYDGEVGKIWGVRVVRADNVPTGEEKHYSLVIGKNAYGVVDINGSSKPEVIVKDAGSSGTSDPLNQRSSVGYKLCMAAMIIEDLAVLRIVHTVSK